jgi:pimeloyl-ACP methyl ester carboxylesterase
VRNYVLHNLRTRASNISALDLYSVTVGLYSGDGRSTGDYGLETEYTLPYLPAGGRMLVDVQTVDKRPITVEPITGICATIPLTESAEFLGTPKKKENVNLFPALFVPPIMLDKLGTEADSYGALAFVIDPDQDFAEIDKQNNQATLYYSVITRTAPSALPTTPDPAPFVIAEFEPNDICLVPTLPLEIDFTLAAGSDISQPGAQYLSVPVFTPATQIIRIANRGNDTIRNGRLLVNGEEIAANLVITPGGSLIQTKEIVPKQGGPQTFVAEIMGIDDEGNSVGPASDKAIINGLRNSQAFEITLYDASPLAKQDHPWSRWNLHWDHRTGATLPVVGAVTDGAALLRLDVQGLEPSEPVTVTIKDVTVRGATDGLGKLEVLDSMGATISQGVRVISDGLTIVVANPAILGVQGNVYYRPPSGFVRPDHYLQDTYLHPAAVNAPQRPPRLTREVDVRFDQQRTGYATQRIRLKRPPVFLFHGYGGDPTVWNKFRPIVPPPCAAVSTSPPPTPTGVFIGCGGVSLKPNRFVPGYDSRFMVFAAGSSPTIKSIADEAKGNYWRFTAALQNDALKDYAIAGVDVIANSMGGLITREIARQFVKDLNLPTPIHKLITIGTPHIGSPVANKVIEVRDSLGIEFEFDPLRFLYETPDGQIKQLTPSMSKFLKVNKCAVLLKALGSGKLPGFAGLNMYSGAAVDLQMGSAAVLKLQGAGVLIPSHYIVGDIDNANLAARAISEGGVWPSEIALMWLGLGIFCGWTPDPLTVDTTQALRSSGSAIYGAASLIAFGPGGILDALGLVKDILEFATEDPEPLLPIGNDRVVHVISQRDWLGPQAEVMTVIRGNTDHLDIKETNVEAFQDSAVAECNRFIDSAWAHPNHRPNRTLTDKNQVACLAVFLLEAYTDSPFFCQPGADCYGPEPGPGAAPLAAGDTVEADKSAILSVSQLDAPGIASTPSLTTTLDFTATTVLTITSPPAGAVVRPGQRIEVHFAISPPSTPVEIIAGVNLAASTAVTPGLSAIVTVPVDAVGTQDITVLVIGENGAIYGNAIDVLVDPGRLRAIAISAPPQLGTPGQVLPLRILGDYADDVQRDITPADAGTTYASSNETILGVTANGLIQVRKNGVAILRVVNRNPLTGRAVSAQQRIEVAVPESQANGIPVASATVTPTVPIEKFTYLNGAGSSDPDDDPLSYRWEQTGGPVVVLVDANTATPHFISPRIDYTATLTFELTVSDDKGASSLPFPVQVTVTP